MLLDMDFDVSYNNLSIYISLFLSVHYAAMVLGRSMSGKRRRRRRKKWRSRKKKKNRRRKRKRRLRRKKW